MLKKNISAFTLPEILAVVAVLIILILLALPSFEAILQNNRTLSLANELISALKLARSEAIKRSSSVSVCAAADTNINACGSNWNNGWLVFTNPNEDNQFDNNDSEILLRVQQVLGQGHAISTTPTTGIATYTSTGFPLSTTSNTIFNISANGCTGNNARSITITASGRLISSASAC